MTDFTLQAWLLVLLPLLGSCLWFWVGPKLGEKAAGYGAVAAIFGSFLCTLSIFLNVEGPTRVHLMDWIRFSATQGVSFSFLFDPLSLALGLVVTGVGSLIHLYATSYMHGDAGFGRFFSYLNLFVFSMLMLTFSDTLVGTFLGWEGVGVCSYLLISFWFSDEANAAAGKKAFIVNRVGDLGFLLAMFSLFKAFGTLTIPEILNFVQASSLTADQVFWTNWACWGLILGAAGKSAQIPLYVWLPDAMAGPTPVSALIHAATMVTAGIYLTCRMQPLFLIHAETLEVLGLIGGLTAFFAATVAIFQNDIKRVLAYSTISQLGLMFLAVGLAAPVAAYFHLITHAFFKALLFLGAGSVIHGLHHEQDMRRMGGLRHQMPITFWAMTIGVLAIAGIPPLSGFVSKDEILHAAASSHRTWAIFLGFATAVMTAFYMGRLWVMTFFGKFRGHHAAHESPWQMTVVLSVLAVASVVAGILNWPELWGGSAHLHHYLGTVISQASHSVEGHDAFAESVKLAIISSLVGLSGLVVAFLRYRNFAGEEFKATAWNVFKNKYYIDEVYDAVVVKNLKRLGDLLWKRLDMATIDAGLNGLASSSQRVSLRLRNLQSGMTQQYAFWVWVGLLILIVGAYSTR